MVQYGLDEALPTDTTYDALKHKLRVNTEVTPGAALGPSQVPQVGPSYGMSAAPAQGEAVGAAPTVTSTPMAGPEAVGLSGVKDTRGFKTLDETAREQVEKTAADYEARGLTDAAAMIRATNGKVSGSMTESLLQTPEQKATELADARAFRLKEIDRTNAGGGSGSSLSPVYLQAISENPSLMMSMTPTERTRVQRALLESGFQGLGREMTPIMLARVTEEQTAMASLRSLKDEMEKAEEKLGPVSGWSKLNPYDETARSLLGNIDLVRQRVGKALEGGVLRKEDEEKYKRILAVMTDLPEVAYSKIDNLIETLERDAQIYRNVLHSAGYRPLTRTNEGPDTVVTETEWERGPDGKMRKKGGS